MNKPIRSITAAPTELLGLATVRAHLKIDTDTTGSPPTHPDDAIVAALTTVARESAEAYTGRTIAQQSFELALDEFADEIDLQTWPVTGVTAITYVDANGTTQTLSASVYVLDNYAQPAAIRLAYDQQWPDIRAQANAVKITFAAGHTVGSPNNYPCPQAIEQAMLLTIGHLYENRQSVVGTQRYELPMGVQTLLQPYRINLGV